MTMSLSSKMKTSISFSFCIPLFLFILASVLLFVGNPKCFGSRVIEHEPTKESISEHRKLREEKEEGFKTAVKKDHGSEPSLIKFDELMSKFDQNAPVTNVIPTCLAKPSKNTAPAILMSLGRSGSTTIWLMLSDLTNSKDYGRAKEFPGENLQDSLYFFDTTIPAKEKMKSTNKVGDILRTAKAKESEVPGLNNSEHGEWLVNYICRLQKERQNGLNGFKWKPNFDQFVEREEARESVQLLASLASAAGAVGQKPPISLIRSRRNALDVKLSTLSHAEHPELSAMCDEGDKKCIKSHKKKIFVQDTSKLFNQVLTTWKQENMIDDLLYALEVSFVSVTYDTLFYADQISDREDEWNKMIQWVKPSSARVSWADVQNSMSLAATTSSRNHADIIENWEDVYKTFQETEIEHLFRLN